MAKRKRTAPQASAPAGNPGLLVNARYDAASNGRRLAEWNAPNSGPNRAIEGLPKIRNRSRDAGRNEWSGASSSRVMVTNLVGTGILCRPKTKSKQLKERLTDSWNDWCEVADADGVLDFYGLQTLVVRSWFQSGEVFARLRPRRLYDGLPAPLQVQVIESDFCPMLDADQWPGMPAGNRMRQGIELDRLGRRVAYWMHREHPGEKGAASIGHHDLVRIAADQILHIYNPLRPGQLRGVPDSAPILAKLRTIMNFDDAVLTRQQIANLFTTFIIRPTPAGTDASIDPLTGKTIQHDSDGAPMASLEPGISQELLPGEDVKFSNPPDAGANYADYMRAQMLAIASGQGTPYELLTGDIKDVSDRTLRVIINEFRRYCEQLQWTIIIPKFCRPVRHAWVTAALIAGVLNEAEAVEARRCEWSPHGWAYIHPVQDVQAKKLEVEEGFRSRSSVITERGDDPETVDAERAEDQQREIDLGLGFEPVDPNAPVKPSPEEEAAAERTKAEARLLDAQADRQRNEGDAALIRARADATRLQAEADLAVARANQAKAEAAAAETSAEHLRARTASEAAQAELRQAIDNRESAERIALLASQREDADAEADRRRQAHEAAEAHAEEMRALAKQAEQARVETARLEVEAARVGLAELRGE